MTNFFAYYEETDLIARLLRSGFRAYYNPLALAWHKVAASTSNDPSFYLYMMHRNRYFFAVKNLDSHYLSLFLNNYRREVIAAFIGYFINRGNIDAGCRIKAYRWVQRNNNMIHSARTKIQKLGNSYTDNLKTNPRNDVTVIIPCYNYGQFIAEAIESALNQTVLPKKIIIINDGSTDNSKVIIDSFKHNSLIEIIHKSNTGVIDSKNLGIKMSSTYWTVFLDADDKLSRTFLEETLGAARNGVRDIVYTDMQLFGAINDVFTAKPFHTYTLLKGNYINNSSLIKTSLLKQVNGYKAQMRHGLEDWELYITLAEAGAKPQYLPRPLVNYRQHRGSLSRNMSGLPKERELIKQMKDLHRSYYRRNGYYKTMAWYGLKLFGYSVRYPGLILVLILAIPLGLKQALSYMYSKGTDYIQKKRDLITG